MEQTPSYAQAVALPQTWSTRVPADFIDENGHMTVAQYAVLGGHGTASLLEAIGVDDHYRSARRMGFFVAEQHVTLATEILQDSSVSMHPRVIEHTTKTVHLISYLVNRSTQQVASSLEETLVHVDLDTRRSRPMPAQIARGLDDLVNKAGKLTWSPRLAGCMRGPRRRDG